MARDLKPIYLRITWEVRKLLQGLFVKHPELILTSMVWDFVIYNLKKNSNTKSLKTTD